MSIRSAIQTKWPAAEAPQPPASQTSQGEAYVKGDPDEAPVLGLLGGSWKFIEEHVHEKMNRRRNIEIYNQMDDDYPEVATALDIYADNATQTNLSADESSRGRDHVIQIFSENEKLRDFLQEIRDRLNLDYRAWGSIRNLAKYGEIFEEIVVDDKLKLRRIKELPHERMVRNEDKFGVLPKTSAFLQFSNTYGEIIARFDDWEVMHSRLLRSNSDVYGNSILQPLRKTYKRLQMIEDSMVLTRLTRASSKLVYFVDVGQLPPPLARKHVNEVKADVRKRRLFDARSQQLKDDYNPLASEEDIFMATRTGSKADVKQLYGDINIGNLDDVKFFHTKLLGGLKVPKSYLQITEDTRGKAELTVQDIQFARIVRRLQLAYRLEIIRLLKLSIVLEWPGKVSEDLLNSFTVSLPSMQTVDELRNWEMRRVQAEVARIMMNELFLDPVTILTQILGYPEAAAKALYKGPDDIFKAMNPTPGVAANNQQNRASSFRATANKQFSRKTSEAYERVAAAGVYLEDLRTLVDWSLEARESERLRDQQDGKV